MGGWVGEGSIRSGLVSIDFWRGYGFRSSAAREGVWGFPRGPVGAPAPSATPKHAHSTLLHAHTHTHSRASSHRGDPCPLPTTPPVPFPPQPQRHWPRRCRRARAVARGADRADEAGSPVSIAASPRNAVGARQSARRGALCGWRCVGFPTLQSVGPESATIGVAGDLRHGEIWAAAASPPLPPQSATVRAAGGGVGAGETI